MPECSVSNIIHLLILSLCLVFQVSAHFDTTAYKKGEMNQVINAFQEAFQLVWQDKKTLWSRLWLPFLMFLFILFLLSLSLGEAGGNTNLPANNSGQNSKPTMGFLSNGNGKDLINQLKARKDLEFDTLSSIDTIQTLLDKKIIDLAVVIDEGFDNAVNTGKTGEILVYYNTTGADYKDGVMDNINWYENRVLAQRLDSIGLPEDFTDPINISEVDASQFSKEATSNNNGGFFNEIGAIFILAIYYFVWLGGIYPALALFTSEATQFIKTDFPRQVFFGKTLAITIFHLIHGGLLFLFLYLLVNKNSGFTGFYKGLAQAGVNINEMPLLLLGMIPLSILFGTFTSWSVLKNRTFKMAQNRLQPLKITIFILLFLGLSASFGVNLVTQIIPAMSIGTVGHQLLSDNFTWTGFALAYVSTLGIAVLCYQEGEKIFLTVAQPETPPVEEDRFLAIDKSDQDFSSEEPQDKNDPPPSF